MAKSKQESNAEYYARHRDRLFVYPNELRPTTIAELVQSIEAADPHKLDKRPARLRELYRAMTGEDLLDDGAEPPANLGEPAE